jgi:tartrate-resistant acid phosphatase type 5
MKIRLVRAIQSVLLVMLAALPSVGNAVTIGAIANYGVASNGEANVAQSVSSLVKSWNPDFIITMGDNNADGLASTIDTNIGQYYHEFIYPYSGVYGAGAASNRFFPSIGNGDWFGGPGMPSGAVAYRNYFSLPGNERYYNFRRGEVELFALNSYPPEPDGITNGSVQARWLESALAASTATWKIVYWHESAFGSGLYAQSPSTNGRFTNGAPTPF